MKNILFILFVLINWYDVHACTILPETFCRSVELQEDYVIVYGQIASQDQDGLDLEVIEVLRGSESRSQIRIWDGTDFDCNGIWDMSTRNIGTIGDTIIISLPRITEKENSWDVIGDYRRPDPYHFTSELRVKNGKAEGLISGDAIAPPAFNILLIEVERLIESISNFEDCSDIISTTREIDNEQTLIYPNPFSSIINIHSASVPIAKIEIYNKLGNKIMETNLNANNESGIDLSHLGNGLYFLQIHNKRGHATSWKIIKY